MSGRRKILYLDDNDILRKATAMFLGKVGFEVESADDGRDAVERGLGQRTRYLVARRDGKIEGVLPLAEIKSRLFGHSLVSTPGCVYGGALAICLLACRSILVPSVRRRLVGLTC